MNCICIAMKKAKLLAKNHEKSRSEREAKVVRQTDGRRPAVRSGSGVAASLSTRGEFESLRRG